MKQPPASKHRRSGAADTNKIIAMNYRMVFNWKSELAISNICAICLIVKSVVVEFVSGMALSACYDKIDIFHVLVVFRTNGLVRWIRFAVGHGHVKLMAPFDISMAARNCRSSVHCIHGAIVTIGLFKSIAEIPRARSIIFLWKSLRNGKLVGL